MLPSHLNLINPFLWFGLAFLLTILLQYPDILWPASFCHSASFCQGQCAHTLQLFKKNTGCCPFGYLRMYLILTLKQNNIINHCFLRRPTTITLVYACEQAIYTSQYQNHIQQSNGRLQLIYQKKNNIKNLKRHNYAIKFKHYTPVKRKMEMLCVHILGVLKEYHLDAFLKNCIEKNGLIILSCHSSFHFCCALQCTKRWWISLSFLWYCN